MSTSKIKIKLGAIEVEYEGSESFLKEELPALLEAVSHLYSQSTSDSPPITEHATPTLRQMPRLAMTTANVAAKLQAKTGPDLLMAAAVRLAFSVGSEVNSRQQILEEMKSATGYFKPAHTGNLSKMLHSLIKDGRLNEPSKGNYALTAAAASEMEARLA